MYFLSCFFHLTLILFKFPPVSEGCPLLEQLNISWCDQVTKDGIQALVRSCPGLKGLFLKGCTQVQLQAGDKEQGWWCICWERNEFQIIKIPCKTEMDKPESNLTCRIYRWLLRCTAHVAQPCIFLGGSVFFFCKFSSLLPSAVVLTTKFLFFSFWIEEHCC